MAEVRYITCKVIPCLSPGYRLAARILRSLGSRRIEIVSFIRTTTPRRVGMTRRDRHDYPRAEALNLELLDISQRF